MKFEKFDFAIYIFILDENQQLSSSCRYACGCVCTKNDAFLSSRFFMAYFMEFIQRPTCIHMFILHHGSDGVDTTFKPLDAGRRYTGFAQTSKRRQTPVYRVCANFPTSPDPGIPGLHKLINRARHRYTGFIF